MANEYLKRTHTSSGNYKVATFSLWIKGQEIGSTQQKPIYFYDGSTLFQVFFERSTGTNPGSLVVYSSSTDLRFGGAYRDVSSWMHLVVSVDTTKSEADRISVYLNGSKLDLVGSQSSGTPNYPAVNAELLSSVQTINALTGQGSYQVFDYFFVDGQALTPDVFGFYKDGKGYQSSGSTEATDFRPGQWSPHSPRKIKTEIERKGGFGVNGFYLPMNDSSNPGADFHTTPNSIITLKGEDLPQPRNGAPTTSDSYVSQLRPQTGELFNDGIVDFGGTGDRNALQDSGDAINLGTGEFTVEAFVYHTTLAQNSLQYIFMSSVQSNPASFAFAVENDRIVAGPYAGSFSNANKVEATFPVGTLKTGQWYHYAACRSGNTLRLFIDGKKVVEDTSHTENYNNTSAFGCRVGSENGDGSSNAGYKSIKGYMSNVRVVNGTALYTSNFTPPTSALTAVTNTVLLCCQSPTSVTTAAVSPGTLSLLTYAGDTAATAARNELDASLILAVPGITGAPGVAYSDFSANIKGSGTNKTLTANGNAGVAVTASYYGSAMSFDGNGDYFTHASNSDFQFGTGDFTVEFWMKRTDSGTNVGFLDTRTTNTDGNGWFIRCNAATSIELVDNAAQYANLTHSSDWNHIAFVRDSNLITGYVNGVAGGITTDVSTNFSSSNFLLGGFVDTQASPNAYGGYIQDLRVYKGVAKYKGGFDVPKPYTPVGIDAFRTTSDTCKNNFATLNPLTQLDNNQITYTNGNLSGVCTPNTNSTISTLAMGSQKYYAEFTFEDNTYPRTGVIDSTVASSGNNGSGTGTGANNLQADGAIAWGGWSSELYINSTTNSETGTGYGNGDIIGVAYDGNTRNVWFSKNGVWQNFSGSGADPASGTNPVGTLGGSDAVHFAIRPEQSTGYCNFGQNPTFSGQITAGTFTDSNGKGLFKYQPPTGFLALCEDNLPTPAIADPGDHFKTVLYTGSGSARTVTGVGFKPDLVWIKKRTTAGDHKLIDSVRGAGLILESNTTDVEGDETGNFSGFSNNGFDLSATTAGAWNESSYNYVAWCWKAGGASLPNTDGTLTSQVSVNETAGFSIATYTTGGTATTFGHGLGKKPAFALFKARNNSGNWAVYHQSLGTNTIRLSTTGAEDTSSDAFNSTAPTDTLMYLGTWAGTNGTDINWVSYLWAEIEGYSKFGAYVGNASADGTFVYCGFKPALVITKRTDSTSSWLIHDSSRDPVNPVMGNLYAHSSDPEARGSVRVDFVSNGFKHRNADGGAANNYANDYIFMAWAESPFKTANAK